MSLQYSRSVVTSTIAITFLITAQFAFSQQQTTIEHEDIKKVISKYQADFGSWVQAVSQASSVEERNRLIKKQPNKEKVAAKLLEMASATDSVSAQQRALVWVYIESRDDAKRDTAIAELLEKGIPKSELVVTCAALERDRNERARKALQQIADTSDELATRQFARVTLASWLVRLGKEQSSQQAEEILQEIVDGNENPTLPNGESITEVANARLNELRNLAVGRIAPNIDGIDLRGDRLNLRDLRGKTVLLSFWAHWCSGCIHQAKIEKELLEALADVPFCVIGVNGDVGDPAEILAKNKEREMEFRSFANDSETQPFGSIAKQWNVQTLPTSYLIGPEGEILGKWVGKLASFDEVIALVPSEANPQSK